MLSNAARVRAFHRAVAAAAPDCPTAPDGPLLALRETLIDEEYREVKAAASRLRARLVEGPLPGTAVAELAHELADLLYVTYGALIACGVDADAVFAAVHRANMAKASGPRRADGKQMKPAGWQPADVAAVVAAMCAEAA